MIDLHSHILPGIDDGAEKLADSMAMAQELVEQGVTEVIATPHYVDETIYTSPAATNRRLMRDLQRALDDARIKIQIHLGNEIYLNERVTELIAQGKVSTLADSKYILVELPMSGEYPGYLDALQGLMEDDYKVILAHPERYVAMQNDFAKLVELHQAGVLLQCNLGSLIGQYGKHAKKVVRELLKRKMVFGFGSDIHHCRGEEYWEKVWKKIPKYCDDTEQILTENPQKILEASQ